MKRAVRGLLPLAALLAVVWLAVGAMEPPPSQPDDAPRGAFSAARAMRHVRQIARAPHPTGSREQAQVRDYVAGQFRQLGLAVRRQKTVAWRDQKAFVRAATVENIIARLPGTDKGSQPAVMLCAHYDSHNTGPGAGDDGAGVAALLETARALQAGASQPRDVLFVVTDAEEAGLIGAEGFVREAPEAKNIALVLNFEARGGGGPVFMFETSNGNASLVERFAQAAPHPLASSLMYALYKLLPNDTDLSVFKSAGIPGLNFAFAGSWSHYHTALDTPDGLDLRSMQQHGDYALALAHHFGQSTPLRSSTGDAAYFDLLGRILIHYPFEYQWPLAAAAILVLAIAGFRARTEPHFWKALGISFAVFPLTLAAGAFAAILFCRGIAPLRAQTPWNDPYDARLLEAALSAVVGGLVWAVWAALPSRFSARALLIGILVWWAVLLALTLMFLPGAAYLFLWPLLLTSLALLPSGESYRAPVVLAGFTSLVLTVPVLHGIGLLMGFGLPPALGILGALAAAPLCPLFRLGDYRQRLVSPTVLAICGVVLALVLSTRDTPSPERPRTDTLFYFLDADKNTATWATADSHSDEWTRNFLGASPRPVPGTAFFPWSTHPYLATDTQVLNLPAPTITRNGNRFTIRSQRAALELVVAGSGVTKATLDGRTLPIDRAIPFCLRFLAPPAEGITVDLEAKPGTVLTIDDYTYRLPDDTLPRPSFLIAQPLNPVSDQTIVRTQFRF